MKLDDDPQDILRQISLIDRMERGKLCPFGKGRNGPFFRLQRWQDGRNSTEYVPQDQVPVLEENIEAYNRFETLVDRYVDLITEATRQQRKAGAKKKRRAPGSPSPRRPKSKT